MPKALADRQGFFYSQEAPRAHARGAFAFARKAVMLTRVYGLAAGIMPAVCVVAVCAVVTIAIVAWLVRDLGHRAIDKSAPDQVAAVLLALAALVGPFRWIWPWSHNAASDRPSEAVPSGQGERVLPGEGGDGEKQQA